MHLRSVLFFFFFNDTATTEIYTLSLHDALPIYEPSLRVGAPPPLPAPSVYHQRRLAWGVARDVRRSEEHTSELQSQSNLVCRLLLEKKNNDTTTHDEVFTPLHETTPFGF